MNRIAQEMMEDSNIKGRKYQFEIDGRDGSHRFRVFVAKEYGNAKKVHLSFAIMFYGIETRSDKENLFIVGHYKTPADGIKDEIVVETAGNYVANETLRNKGFFKGIIDSFTS